MASVLLSHVEKYYRKSKRPAVKDFNLNIRDRELIVLVGPSGCGKSTTLRMIAGLESISSGDLYIDGKRVNKVDPKDRNIAMVFQNYALYPHMTAYKNMAFGLKLKNLTKKEIDEKVRQAAEVLGLKNYLNRKPKFLSGGQRQRVALGRAMVRSPRLFLMDEPLSNLDAKLRVQMRVEISKLHQRLKTTTIYVTHDQTEAMTMADRLVVMNHGEIQQIGTPDDIYHHPANVFVGGFIGSPAMNFFPVSLSGDKVRFGSINLPLPQAIVMRLHEKNYRECRLIAGIRPEDIQVGARTDQNDPCFVSAVVKNTELLGPESLVHFQLSQTELIARTQPLIVTNGSSIQVSLNEAKIHFFDPDSRNRII